MKNLERRLELGDVISISISAMLGSGIFVLPSLVIPITGTSAWLCYIVGALSIVPAAFSKSELATAMPTSGGTYVYIERTFGPLFGTIIGIGLWLSLLLKCSFALVGFGAYLSVITPVNITYVSISLLIAITILNVIGIGKVSSAIKYIIIISITCLIVLGSVALYSMPAQNLQTPFLAAGWQGLFSSSALIIVSFAGVTKVAAIAEEIKRPERNLPVGILISLVVVTALYCFINFVLTARLPMENFVSNFAPIHTLAESLRGKTVGIIAAVLAIVTMTSMANAGILASSRFPFAMSRDNLIPPPFSSINAKFLTPSISILFTSAAICICLIFLEVEKIAKLASFFVIAIFGLVNLTVIILRETRVQWYEPTFKSPFYPWIQIAGIIFSIIMVWSLKAYIIPSILITFIPGIILFLLYSRHQTSRKGVLGIRGRRADLVSKTSQHSVENIYEDMEDSPIDESNAKAVVALFGFEKATDSLIELGIAISEEGGLEVARVKELPEQTDLHIFDERRTPEFLSLYRRIKKIRQSRKIPIHFDFIPSHDVYETVYELSTQLHCKWLVMEWIGKSRESLTFHKQMGWLTSHLKCHVILVKDRGIRFIQNILVLLDYNYNNSVIIEAALLIQKSFNADITLACFYSSSANANAANQNKDKPSNDNSLIRDFLHEVKNLYGISGSIKELEGRDEVRSVVQESSEHDLLIFATKHNPSWHRGVFGSKHDKIKTQAACNVISIYPFGRK